MTTAIRSAATCFRPFLIIAFMLGLAPLASLAAGKGQVLFDGKNLDGWRKPTGTWTVAKAVSLDAGGPTNFVIAPGQGIAVNCASGHTVDLVTEQEFGDMELHVAHDSRVNPCAASSSPATINTVCRKCTIG